MAAGQWEAAEAWSAAGEAVEGEVWKVAQVRQVEFFQTRQSWSDLEKKEMEFDPKPADITTTEKQ